jgi:thioesterase domain-containing protein
MLEYKIFLRGLLDEGAPGRSLVAFRSSIAPSGGEGVYTGRRWTAKMGIPARNEIMDRERLRQIALTAGLSSKIIIPLSDDALDPQSTAPSFYCVHPISGTGAVVFIDLAMEMGRGVRFFAIQAPATLMKNADYSDLLKSIASHYADAIARFQPDGPIHVGGWSAGAVVALETARQLRAKGREVSMLVAIDGAPKNTKVSGSPLWYPAKVLWNLPRALWNDNFGRLRKQVLFRVRNLRMKKKPPQLNDTASHPVRGFTKNFSLFPEYRQRFMVALYDAIEKAAFLPYDGTVVVYRSRIMPIPLTAVREFWTSIAQNCEIVEVRANHLNVVHWPQVVPVAADLKQRLMGKVPPPGPR